MAELKSCPACNKQPRIRQERDSSGAWCIIQCKPFLRKPHLKIECGKASPERAYAEAVEAWNAMVTDIESIQQELNDQ